MADQSRADSAPTRVAVVAGRRTGIGFAAAQSLAIAGFDVVIAGRRADILSAAVAELSDARGAGVTSVTADVDTPDGARHLVDRTIEHHGRLDCLVTAAGIY